MNDAQRYRMNAAECLSAAERCDPAYRGLTLAIAASWLSLARQQEAVDGLLAIWSKAQSAAPIRPAAFSALRGTAGQMGNCLKGGQQDLEIFMSYRTYNRANTAPSRRPAMRPPVCSVPRRPVLTQAIHTRGGMCAASKRRWMSETSENRSSASSFVIGQLIRAS
jgi:hypothetical protein